MQRWKLFLEIWLLTWVLQSWVLHQGVFEIIGGATPFQKFLWLLFLLPSVVVSVNIIAPKLPEDTNWNFIIVLSILWLIAISSVVVRISKKSKVLTGQDSSPPTPTSPFSCYLRPCLEINDEERFHVVLDYMLIWNIVLISRVKL